MRYWTRSPPNPWLATGVALLSLAFAVFRFFRIRPKLRALRQGIDGERAVGQYLERLRGSGYQVFHDIVGPSFNLDHVLIGPAGVFTIETKTWSKPARGEARITVDGETLRAANHVPERNPVAQALAQASWLRNLLAESTGRKLDVFPVVLFPGWFIDQTPESRRQLWVLEPKALPAFLEREPQRLPAEDANMASFHLSRFVRSSEAARLKGLWE